MKRSLRKNPSVESSSFQSVSFKKGPSYENRLFTNASSFDIENSGSNSKKGSADLTRARSTSINFLSSGNPGLTEYFNEISNSNSTTEIHTVNAEYRLNSLRNKLLPSDEVSLLDQLDTDSDLALENIKKMDLENLKSFLDTCLLWSCIRGNKMLAEFFLARGANPLERDIEGFTALHLAAECGSLDIVQLLGRNLSFIDKAYSKSNRKKMTPLMLAAINGHVNVVKYFIDCKVNVNEVIEEENKTALYYAVCSNNKECVNILLQSGAIIDSNKLNNETPLHRACKEGYTDIIKLLIENGANVSALKGSNKLSCLHLASRSCQSETLSLLLNAKADPNKGDSNGRTPLHYATRNQCVESVKLLIKHNANPNCIDHEGRTPLHTGIFKGSSTTECLHQLLKVNANPNIADNSGYSPLHLAALNDFTHGVKILLSYGADLTQVTNGGITALNIILRRTPHVISEIQQSLNNAINFVDNDYFDREGQIQLDFRVLMSGKEDTPECRLLSCFIKEGQKYLLKHPLCETFLYLKWLRVRSFFILNILLYGVFLLCLTGYTYIAFIATSEHYRNLINETNMMTTLKYFDGAVGVPKIIRMQPLYKAIYNGMNVNEKHNDIEELFKNKCFYMLPIHTVEEKCLLYTIWSMLFLLALKELYQIIDSPKSYLASFDNLLVWPVILGSFTITIFSYYTDYVCPWEFHVAAFVILLGWVQLLLLVGRFPLFGLYIHMFTKVTKNFGKFLLAYTCLINAFSLSFGVLFHNQRPFQETFVRLLKTIVMMAGEIDYNDWFYESPPNEQILYAYTSHIIFAMFLFFVTIILMNLLVGLAVSDIQGLQKSAGLDRLVRQTQLIVHFELLLFSKWLTFLVPAKIRKIITDRVLLLNSAYGNIFILHQKSLTLKSFLPSEVTENVKRVARSRDQNVQNENRPHKLRHLYNTIPIYQNEHDQTYKDYEFIKYGLDIAVCNSEESKKEMSMLKAKVDKISTLLEDYEIKNLPKESS